MDKGHKIIAAIYLVTGHLSASDPLVAALRESAVALVDTDARVRAELSLVVTELLAAAVLAGFVSEKNASIISLEVRRYGINRDDTEHDGTINALFTPSLTPTLKDIKRTSMVQNMSVKQMSDKPKPQVHFSKEDTKIIKSNRHDTIMSFIIGQASATIKDIAALFPGVSEKTIQRELNYLVSNGRITKRGEKRWSVYMASK